MNDAEIKILSDISRKLFREEKKGFDEIASILGCSNSDVIYLTLIDDISMKKRFEDRDPDEFLIP